jgi:hypothetical protein
LLHEAIIRVVGHSGLTSEHACIHAGRNYSQLPVVFARRPKMSAVEINHR